MLKRMFLILTLVTQTTLKSLQDVLPTSQTDIDVNNVQSTILGGGDMVESF